VENCAIWQNRQRRRGSNWNWKQLLRKRNRKKRSDAGFKEKNRRKDLGRKLKKQKN
jgi:hypothetical protein